MGLLSLMVGQMLVIGFQGKSIDDSWPTLLQQQVSDGQVGNIILFSHNIESPHQIKKLNHALSEAARGSMQFGIAIDQEGGKIQRLRASTGFTDYMSPQKYGEESPKVRYQISQQMAMELKAYGFNINFAPSVDLHSLDSKIIGVLGRSFGVESSKVVEASEDFVNGHHYAGVVTCLKHFPGHGLAIGDSHEGWVDVTQTAQTDELVPFADLIRRDKADMIMTAHVFNRQYDEKHPATLSPNVIRTLLREQMGYDGVVIGDDLHMGAILQHYSLDEAIVLALQAGCDMLIFSNNPLAAMGVKDFAPDPDLPTKVHAIIRQAIDDGKLSYAQIEHSYQRIVAMKKKVLQPFVDEN
ncbi:MAG: beta-N-acetylhexosaminidase [Alphaproteobacteria bacterium]|nr:beta-N-acetylhexosaminidase [Alphaproteobacteria bacterium]OJV47956.1 MAG: hypothetical protein BGO28_03765 [Alphaproteobacteria bacterium 43-37]